jgi:3-dehydroquinate synthase
MGMAIMTRACVRMGRCPAECWQVLEELLDKYHLPKTCSMERGELLEAAKADKKRRGDTITLIQPDTLGHCLLHKTDYRELDRVLELGMEL